MQWHNAVLFFLLLGSRYRFILLSTTITRSTLPGPPFFSGDLICPTGFSNHTSMPVTHKFMPPAHRSPAIAPSIVSQALFQALRMLWWARQKERVGEEEETSNKQIQYQIGLSAKENINQGYMLEVEHYFILAGQVFTKEPAVQRELGITSTFLP